MARHVSSILPFIMPWNMNENDILDLEAFQENLQQYISYLAIVNTGVVLPDSQRKIEMPLNDRYL
ncbi:hypothetical protein HPB52_010536 [Rhipicephalus sanguineus]|uniref:Uncharacterized protein n=1 Tax=Rhipicephalus sanguineus TaxID=34632 RepID=A0A9D4YP41_RHISA|nr:hypothetical protein HPB52_010536 [Rhipicephalus sanguineus]